MREALESLLGRSDIWCARRPATIRQRGLPTGFEDLDQALPSGGWPLGALSEILSPGQGLGELRLILPAASRLSARGRHIVWVSPPYRPYAPAIAGHGLSRLLLISPAGVEDTLWAAEQVLRAGAAVAVWLDRAEDRGLRRLQLAAEAGGGWGVLFRPLREQQRPSPAALRLRLEAAEGAMVLHILKCRGGGAGGTVHLRSSPAGAQAVGGPGRGPFPNPLESTA